MFLEVPVRRVERLPDTVQVRLAIGGPRRMVSFRRPRGGHRTEMECRGENGRGTGKQCASHAFRLHQASPLQNRRSCLLSAGIAGYPRGIRGVSRLPRLVGHALTSVSYRGRRDNSELTFSARPIMPEMRASSLPIVLHDGERARVRGRCPPGLRGTPVFTAATRDDVAPSGRDPAPHPGPLPTA